MCETRKESPVKPTPPTGRIIREGGLGEGFGILILVIIYFLFMLFG